MCVCAQSLSYVQLFETTQAVAHQAPLSMGFSRQKYWSGLLFPTPGDLPKSGIKPIFLVSPALAVDSLPLCHLGRPLWEYAAAAKSLQSCPTLSDPMDCSLPGSSADGIFQARVLEWGAIAFSALGVYSRLNNLHFTFFKKKCLLSEQIPKVRQYE